MYVDDDAHSVLPCKPHEKVKYLQAVHAAAINDPVAVSSKPSAYLGFHKLLYTVINVIIHHKLL